MEQAEKVLEETTAAGGNVATPEGKKIKRLSWAELFQVFAWCRQQPPFSHESVKAASAAATAELGFQVGESSLRDAWAACGRDAGELVRPDVPGLWGLVDKITKLEERVSKLELPPLRGPDGTVLS